MERPLNQKGVKNLPFRKSTAAAAAWHSATFLRFSLLSGGKLAS
jgi:hypothetical protein